MKRPCGMDPQLLWEYREGLIDDKQRGRVSDHIQSCDACRNESAAEERLGAALRSGRPSETPALGFRHPEESAVPSLWRWPLTVGAMAAIALLAFGVFSRLQPTPSEGAKMEAGETAKNDDGTVAAPTAGAMGKPPPGDKGAETVVVPPGTNGTGGHAASKGSETQFARGSAKDLNYAASQPAPEAEKKADFANADMAPPDGPGGRMRGGGGGAGKSPTEEPAMKDKVGKVPVAIAYDAHTLHYRGEAGLAADESISATLGVMSKETAQEMYLTRKITLETDKEPLRSVFDAFSQQASVRIDVAKTVPDYRMTLRIENLDFGLAMANVAVASQVEWKAQNGSVLVLPLGQSVKTGARDGRAEEPKPAKRAARFKANCVNCGRPDLGPKWTYCPFCGKPLDR